MAGQRPGSIVRVPFHESPVRLVHIDPRGSPARLPAWGLLLGDGSGATALVNASPDGPTARVGSLGTGDVRLCGPAISRAKAIELAGQHS